MVSLHKPPQLQHPLLAILTKVLCSLLPHGTGQTHVHAPWVTNLRLQGWGHLSGSLGSNAEIISYIPLAALGWLSYQALSAVGCPTALGKGRSR